MSQSRDTSGVVSVDDQQYEWELRRQPQWCTVNRWRSMTIAIRLQDAQREAVLEFPPPPPYTNGSPQHQRLRISPDIVANGIRAAIAAGWNPMSRGKAEVFMVDENGC